VCRHESPGNAGGARAAVRLNHVAVDLNGALAQSRQIGYSAQAAADQALDLLRAAGLLPRAASRAVRVFVARGNMPYSAVSQPRFCPRRKGGTFSSTLAVHSTLVSPNSTSTNLPRAWYTRG